MLTDDQVLALAPDSSSAKAGQELASPHKWQELGANEKLAWGLCQGSGKNPYQCCVDLGQTAFKCSCPSRKFPCKHSLALLLLLSRQSAALNSKEVPAWASTWMASRKERADKKALKTESEQRSGDETEQLNPGRESSGAADQGKAKKAKTASARREKVEAGLEELELWLKDRIRQGLAGLESSSYQSWENAAARLTDAQAPGLARMLRQCAGIPNTGDGWQERLLSKLGLLQLILEAYKRIETLPEALKADLRQIVGFNLNQEELLQSASPVKDTWQVVAQRVSLEERLKVQRSWLRSASQNKWALILNFAHGMQPLDISLSPGTSLEAELVYYPGTSALRALVKSKSQVTQPLSKFNAFASIEEFLDDYANALALNPFIETYPVLLEGVCCRRGKNNFVIADKNNSYLPLAKSRLSGWQLMAVSAGCQIEFCAEWNGEHLLPLSALVNGKFYRLDQKGEADVA